MATVAAQSIPSSRKEISNRETWAALCFYFPQYTLKEASLLPARDIKLLLNTARKLEAQRMFNFTQIAAAPHTQKGQGVKKLSQHFKELSKD